MNAEKHALKTPGLRAVLTVISMADLARELGISHQAVAQWTTVPIHHITAIEQITGIPRAQMRPDIFEVNT